MHCAAVASVAAFVVLAAALSGCAGDEAGGQPSGDGTGRPSAGATTTGTATGTTTVAARPEVLPAVPMTYFASADGSLAATVPSAGELPFASTYVCFFVGQCEILAFQSEPLAQDAMIVPGPVKATLWVKGDTPVLPSGIFDFGLWLGSTRSMALQQVRSLDSPRTPGAFAVDLSFESDDLLPVLVPKGESLQVYFIAGVHPSGTGTVKLLTGGDTPTSVSFLMSGITVDPMLRLGAAQTQSLSGSLVASQLLLGPSDDQSKLRFPVELTASSTLLDIVVEKTSSTSASTDIDIELLAGGELVTASRTPFAREEILLAGPALRPILGKQVDLVVTLFNGANVEFKADITHD